ncbi:DUF6602 domain-containing protein [Polaribacter sargassicola]|uniref:DUF6602 domain-containing protein n=1 Tax=Polaribacter sargassicola TaxID=2836891 RepID=UPI001F310060|nr:DUF6602 domain-containing protein [Polaribacter sp. DS7-9]MCG1037581.1 hypothetical protein [Polaribacter sp. DS7-9]
MAESKKIELKSLFASMQHQMSAQLSTNRDNITHSGSKGDALENAWIEWLRKYLPSRYSVDKAIVIDFEGNISHQIDIVIYDNWFTPFIFTQNGFHYIPAEGVYAVFEVKPDISDFSDGKHNIAYAGEKIESVRVLKREAASFINGGIKNSARPLTKILGGILTSTKSGEKSNNNTLIKHFKEQTNLKSIDIGCIADYGSFYIDYSSPKRIIKKFGREQDVTGEITEAGMQPYLEYYENRQYLDSRFSSSENSFVTFFMQLTRHLQQSIGTVPAINLNKYLESINEQIDEDI